MSPRRQHTAALVLCALLSIGGGLGGCAPVRFKTRNGVYHEVRAGETLWRICYTYQVNMETVCRFNQITDPEQIAVGQEIFIPGAEEVRKVEPFSTSTTPSTMANAMEGTSEGTTPSVAPGTPPPAEFRETSPAPSTKQERQGQPSDKVAVPEPPRPKPGAPHAKLEFIWPVKGPVTSWFGARKGRPHDGIDISAPKGTPIRAAERGKVIYSDDGIAGYGNLIIVQHEGGFHTVYGHNARNLVDVDEVVDKAQVIAEVGNTGRSSSPHLHFEVRRDQRAVDPMKYLR